MNLQYVGGYLDAEGSFAVRGSSISVRVTNTHKATLESLKASYGGSVLLHTKPTDRHRRAFQWALHGQEAQDLIERVLPHLQEKRIQALLLLEYRLVGPQDPLRAWIKEALGHLKRLQSPA